MVQSLTVGLDRRGRAVLVKLRLADGQHTSIVLPSTFAALIAEKMTRWRGAGLLGTESQPDIADADWDAKGKTVTKVRCDDYPNGFQMAVRLSGGGQETFFLPAEVVPLLSFSLEKCLPKLVALHRDLPKHSRPH